jgi:hypothetical protein
MIDARKESNLSRKWSRIIEAYFARASSSSTLMSQEHRAISAEAERNSMRDPECAAGAHRRTLVVLLPHHIRRATKPRIGVILFLIGVLWVSTVRAQITPPPEPVDPSPINGEMYYLINQVSAQQMDLNDN